MIKLLKVDIDREWTASDNMKGSARFEISGQVFDVTLSNGECQDIADLIDKKLIESAEIQTKLRIDALKTGG